MGLINWLKTKISNDSGEQNNLLEDIKFPDTTHVFLIGFSYDRPTKEMYTWTKDFLSQTHAASRVFRFNGENFSKQKLAEQLDQELNRVEIFCGHGSSKGLFGPPFNELSQDILKEVHHIIYDADMQRLGPSSMFAFCCGTAAEFGREFVSLRDNRFIGFQNDIPLANELYGDLKLIFQTIARSIIQKGRIENEHAEYFTSQIQALLDDLKRNPGKYSFPNTMGSILEHYQDSFRAFI